MYTRQLYIVSNDDSSTHSCTAQVERNHRGIRLQNRCNRMSALITNAIAFNKSIDTNGDFQTKMQISIPPSASNDRVLLTRNVAANSAAPSALILPRSFCIAAKKY